MPGMMREQQAGIHTGRLVLPRAQGYAHFRYVLYCMGEDADYPAGYYVPPSIFGSKPGW